MLSKGLFKKEIIRIRRRLHQYPELSGKEFKTSKFIKDILVKHKYKTKILAKTGVVGYLDESKPCIAVRADIDALPIQEKTNKSYSSKIKNVMHACGHDANTAIVLGAAILVSENLKRANVKFIFQPAEETANGAKRMIQAGVLNNPKIKTIIGIHVNPYIESGKIGIRYGEMLAAVDKFSIKLYNGGGHAAYPHKGKDTILAASELIQEFQTIVSRKIDPVEPVVISVGKINGGTRFNILADEVNMEGTVRVLNKDVHKNIKGMMNEAIAFISKKHNLKYEFDYETVGYPLKNSENIIRLCQEIIEEKFGKDKIVILEKPSMGGEDFAEYLRYVPGCFLYIGAKKGRFNFPWHHPKFEINEDVLIDASHLLFEIIKKFLNLT